ncbi:energy transducer TonB [Tenacibaculum aestuariivivum]|uniref:energy transducer TonB n=1 Tax=Tenacibaculum aestuariivivum TaxID=2006131 RepID=UPI003AB1326E
MMKFTLFLVAMLISVTVIAQQEKCTSLDESMADPNSITKCAVQDSKDGKKKQLSIQVSTRRRIVRKKNDVVSAIGGTTTSQKVANIKKNTLLVGKLELEDNSTTIERIPFNLVEEIPLFSKCDNIPLIQQAQCFETQMSKHIVKNFVYPKEAVTQGIQGRVLVQFTINEQGNVGAIQVRGPKNGDLLEKEATRIINMLPSFIPGKHNGKIVKVKYGIPITFKHPNPEISEKAIVKKNIKKQVKSTINVKEKIITDFIKFQDVDNIPLFKTCLNVNDSEKNNCFNERMVSHIQRNFNYPAAAAEQNIEGKVWVRFIINKKGKVSNIKMKGPENGYLLEQEAKKMVSKLPIFEPGKQNGEFANVEYYIPIVFTLESH